MASPWLNWGKPTSETPWEWGSCAAFPDCAAYGFFPLRHMNFYEAWSLIHSNDERIDLRDLGFAASFFYDLPGRLLARS